MRPEKSHGIGPLLVVTVLVTLAAFAGRPTAPGAAAAPQNDLDLLGNLPGTAPTALPLTVRLNVTPTLAETGALAYAFCNVTGGVPPYRTVTLSTGDPTVPPTVQYNVSAPGFLTGGEVYLRAGTYVVACTATDSASATASASEAVRIVPPPALTVAASPASLLPGASVTFTATLRGGVAPYVYLWMGLPPDCPYRNASQVTCTPAVAGTWTVTVTVVDSLGASVSNTTTATVTALVLGMPPGEAAVVLGGIAFAVAVVGALVAFRILRRRSGRPSTAPSAPEREPLSTSATDAARGVLSPAPVQSGPSARAIQASCVRRGLALGLLSALSAALYLVLAWYNSFLTGFAPTVLAGLPVLLGVLVAVAAVRSAGPVLPLAGVLAGLALYTALAQPWSACTDSPSLAAALGVPTCGALTVRAAEAVLALGAIATGAGVFLLRGSRMPRSEKPLAALGTVVVALLVAASTAVVTTAPAGPYPSNLGLTNLPFPLPAGSAFLLPFPMRDSATNYTFQWPYAQALTPVAANGFEPAVLVGGWNATVPVCLQVQGFTYGGNGALPSGFYIACGKTVSFRVPLQPAVWQIEFLLRDSAVVHAEVTITQTVHVVY